jgi:DNA-directed RNA polymerase sigma subunit (sigma70/sigma32)
VTNAGKVVQGQDQELNYSDSSQSQSDSDVDESHAADLEQLRVGLEMLPLWHAEVLSRRFGLGGRPQETIMAIAREAGISRTTVYNIQNLALRRLRETMHDQFDPDR